MVAMVDRDAAFNYDAEMAMRPVFLLLRSPNDDGAGFRFADFVPSVPFQITEGSMDGGVRSADEIEYFKNGAYEK